MLYCCRGSGSNNVNGAVGVGEVQTKLAYPASSRRTATGGAGGYYFSLTTAINISSTVFVLTIPVKSLMSISKTPCCFDCWSEVNTDNPL